MIRKLFGETEEEQFHYLQTRLAALAIMLIITLIGFLLALIGLGIGEAIMKFGEIGVAIVLLVFGWAVMRALFGVATIFTLFSSNIVVGVVIFVLYIMIGYFFGMFVAIVGLCRFLVLLKKRKGSY
jgi:ABC-type amino acid transport system permease subunit